MFTCSLASEADHEPILGTAPTDSRWLFVEEPGPWGAKPLAENRLPDAVRNHLAGLDQMAVHLIRRPGRTLPHLPKVLAATVLVTPGGTAVTTVFERELASIDDLLELNLEQLFAGTLPGARAITGPLWFVCANGKRDRCCSVLGRPVAEALGELWPEGTWEVTHLGGHRFAATLLALPSAVTLGRLRSGTAEAAAHAVLRGELPVALTRGRVGLSGADQVLDAHLLGGGNPAVRVAGEPGPMRRQSCGVDEESVPLKKTVRYRIVEEDRPE